MGVSVGLYPEPYAAPWNHDAVIKRRALGGAPELQITARRGLVSIPATSGRSRAAVDRQQRDALGSGQGAH